MFTNIFKSHSILTFMVSFFLTVCAVIFYLYTRNDGEFNPRIFIQGLTLSLSILSLFGIVFLSVTRRISIPFSSIHLLSFPLCFNLFYQDQGLNYEKVILGILFLLALNIFSKDLTKGSSEKSLYSLGVIFTVISFINLSLSIFFLSAFILIIRLNDKRRAIVSLLGGFFLTLQPLLIATYLLTGEFKYSSPFVLVDNLTFNGQSKGTEWGWGFFVIAMLITAIYLSQKKYSGTFKKDNGADAFMLFWLITSIVCRGFNLFEGDGIWLLSFIPTGYFLGNLLALLTRVFYSELLLFAIVAFGVLLKLYNNGILFN